MRDEGNERQFLLLHGYTGSGPQHWQRWLAERLARRGSDVRFPALPNPDSPRLENWVSTLESELAEVDPARVVVLAHSCGSLLWLHYVAGATRQLASRVLLVSPPGPRWREPSVDGFIPVPLDSRGLHTAAVDTRMVAAVDDPYCTKADLIDYARSLGIELDLLPFGAHLNTEAGFGPWPAVEGWAETGSQIS